MIKKHNTGSLQLIPPIDDNPSPTTETQKDAQNPRRENSKKPLEEHLLSVLQDSVLDMPLSKLRLPARTLQRILTSMHQINPSCQSVRDYLILGLDKLLLIKHVTKKTVESLKDAISAHMKPSDAQIEDNVDPSARFTDAINLIFALTPQKWHNIIKLRYGYDSDPKSLRRVAAMENVSQEWVNLVCKKVKKTLSKADNSPILNAAIKRIDDILAADNGITTIEEITANDYFSKLGAIPTKFFLNFLTKEYLPYKYRYIQKSFLTTLTQEQEQKSEADIHNAIMAAEYPLPIEQLIDQIRNQAGDIPPSYIRAKLTRRNAIKTSGDMALCPANFNNAQKARLLIATCTNPLKTKDVTSIFKQYYGTKTDRTNYYQLILPKEYGPADRKKIFVMTGPSTLIAWDKYNMPKNIQHITDECHNIILGLGATTDTRFLLSALKKRGIDTGELNKYALKSILAADRRFRGHRKFQMGLCEAAPEHHHTLKQLLWEILQKSPRPMKTAIMTSIINTTRQHKKQEITLALSRDHSFIRTDKETYGLPKHIRQYDQKKERILKAATSWFAKESDSLSPALLAVTMYSPTPRLRVSLSLIKNVLATSGEFYQTADGSYVPKEKLMAAKEQENNQTDRNVLEEDPFQNKPDVGYNTRQHN